MIDEYKKGSPSKYRVADSPIISGKEGSRNSHATINSAIVRSLTRNTVNPLFCRFEQNRQERLHLEVSGRVFETDMLFSK